MAHQSVLLHEALEGLAIRAEGTYIDGTFGRGGHSRAILQQLSESGRLLAIDKDPEAIAYAKEHFAEDKRFQIYQGSFAKLADFAKKKMSTVKLMAFCWIWGCHPHNWIIRFAVLASCSKDL